MKKRILIPTLIIGTLLTSSLTFAGAGSNCGRGSDACAGGGCNGKAQGAMTYEQHEERMEQRLEKMATILDLSEVQVEKLAALMNQQWQGKQQQREQMQAAREEMRVASTLR